MTLESWLRPAQVLGAIVFGTLTIGGSALASYYGATHKLERVVDRTEQVTEQVAQVREATAKGMAGLQESTERASAQYRAATDARLDALERARAEHERQMAVLEERLRAIGTTMDRMDRRQEVLLDRLNASPRTRTARDYPQ